MEYLLLSRWFFDQVGTFGLFQTSRAQDPDDDTPLFDNSPPMEIWLEMVDGSIFGVADAVSLQAAFSTPVAS